MTKKELEDLNVLGRKTMRSTCRYEKGKIILGYEITEYDRNNNIINFEKADTVQSGGFISEKEANSLMMHNKT